jgi:hypothetical protein
VAHERKLRVLTVDQIKVDGTTNDRGRQQTAREIAEGGNKRKERKTE